MSSMAELQERFGSPAHVWVVDGISHSVMELAVHDGSFMGYDELVAGDCVSFRGELQGGPYRIRVERRADGRWCLRDEPGGFELVC